MIPRVYGEAQPIAKKQVILRLINEGCQVALRAVDEDGSYVAQLVSFTDGKVTLWRGAEARLQIAGYDTSWAKWNEDGRICFEEM